MEKVCTRGGAKSPFTLGNASRGTLQTFVSCCRKLSIYRATALHPSQAVKSHERDTLPCARITAPFSDAQTTSPSIQNWRHPYDRTVERTGIECVRTINLFCLYFGAMSQCQYPHKRLIATPEPSPAQHKLVQVAQLLHQRPKGPRPSSQSITQCICCGVE